MVSGFPTHICYMCAVHTSGRRRCLAPVGWRHEACFVMRQQSNVRRCDAARRAAVGDTMAIRQKVTLIKGKVTSII